MALEIVKVNCSICGKEYETKKNKDYRIRLESGLFYCSKKCTWSNKAKKMRYVHQSKLMKERYGYENSFQLPSSIKKIQEKRNETEIMEKKIKTFQRRYGVNNPQQIPEIKEKTMKTNLKRYGATAYVNSDEYKQIRKDFINSEYGVDYYTQTDEFKKKAKQTIVKKHGKEDYFKFGTKEFKDRMVELYGVENAMHHPEFAEKALDGYSGYYNTNKFYTLPSGKKIRIQGYENKTLDKLFGLGYNEKDILYKKRDMPEIWYNYNGKKRRYYPDFYIPNDNLIIETKSTYTLEFDKDKNNLKFEATKSHGFDFKLDVY